MQADPATFPISPAPSPPQPLARQPRRWPALVTLLTLAPLLPESVETYNTPALSYVANPAIFVYLALFYGCSALLLRNLWRSRRLSWASVVLLGVAFGTLNEGVIAGKWYEIPQRGYALYGGVNWGWAAALTFFHIVWSMLVPIALVEVMFPHIAHLPWLRRRGMILATLGLAVTLLILLARPPHMDFRLVALGGALALVVVALLLPKARARRGSERPAPGLWRLRIAGFFGSALYFILIAIVPGLWKNMPLAAIGGLLVGAFALGAWRLWIWTGRAGWGRAQNLALLTGALTPGIVFSPLALAQGQPILAAAVAILLVILALRVRHLETLKRNSMMSPSFTR